MPQIIDGYCGEPHVDSQDTRIFNASLVGKGLVRSSMLGQCEVTLSDNNTLTVAAGEMVADGTRLIVPKPEDVKIANGVTDMNRHDLLLLRYEMDQVTSVESVSWRVAQGVASSGTPEDPEYTPGDVLDGAIVAEWPLCRVRYDGLTPSEPEMLAPVVKPYTDEIKRLDAAWDSLSQTTKAISKDLEISVKTINASNPQKVNQMWLDDPNGANPRMTIQSLSGAMYYVSLTRQ